MNGHRDAEAAQPFGQTRSMHVTSRAVSEGGVLAAQAALEGLTQSQGVSCRGLPRTLSGLEACLHFQVGVLV